MQRLGTRQLCELLLPQVSRITYFVSWRSFLTDLHKVTWLARKGKEMTKQKHEFAREQLYELVWSEAMVKIASRLGLSDVGLKKVCRRHGIPVPGRGYWRKLETGKRVKKTPLPPREKSPPLVFWTQSETEVARADQILVGIKERLDFEERPENLIAVNQHLNNPHALTAETRERLKKLDWRYGMAVCRSPKLFRVRVSKDSVPRALRIMDALFKAFDKRELLVKASRYDQGEASILIDEEEVDFTLEETLRQRVHQLTAAEQKHKEKHGWSSAPQYDYTPRGNLTLKITSHYWGTGLKTSWGDKADQPLEARLNEFMQGIFQVAAYRRHETIKRENEERRRQEAEARLREIQRRKEAEAKAVRELFETAELWTKVDLLRRYIGAVRSEARDRAISCELDAPLGRWLQWAEAKAAHEDPLQAAFTANKWELPR